ncbi:hypothetical protein [Yersinia similis]|uniref:hypothetical protein n=1 Tax=Yersinia similis TaxID=367190 RepID=UPI00061BD83F|nr:hypothetical protein [Yersinia similis]CNC70559.1 Uncharacterised protein [Yersinia similis]
MKTFYQFRDEQKKKLEEHVFYDLISTDKIEFNNKLMFMPAMVHFIMNFRDMNKWVIRFETPDTSFKSVINGGTIEDETHSRLFLEDWRKLHIDDKLKWNSSDIIYWLFISSEMECFRKYGIDFMRLCIDDESDPILRYAHSESGETCGNVFFSRISPIADRIAVNLNISLRYFGTFHLNLENGHVWESEGVFENIVLEQDANEKVRSLSQRMFDIFHGIHNAFYNYTSNYILTQSYPKFPEMLTIIGNNEYPQYPDLFLITGNNHSNDIIQHINNYLEQISKHPFYEWLKSTSINPLIKLKSFIPLWTVDIMGYRDINRYVFPYERIESDSERLITEYALLLSEHSYLFYNDWKSLQLDEMLRWTASDTLDFIFLNADMDTHRENLVKFSLCGLKNSEPLIRFWFMMILELSGKSFFSYVGNVAKLAEKEYNISLPYLSGKHSSVKELNVFNELYTHFISQELNQEQKIKIKEIADMVLTALLKNLDISYKYAVNNLFAAR